MKCFFLSIEVNLSKGCVFCDCEHENIMKRILDMSCKYQGFLMGRQVGQVFIESR